MTLRGEIGIAIDDHDLEALQKLHRENQDALFRVEAVFAGGTWMHQAAAYGNPEILSWLQHIGFDIDEPGKMELDRPISSAAAKNNIPNMKWLLDRNVTLDVDDSVRNPLFSAIIGKSLEGVKLLLDAGIDASVQCYRTDNGDLDAMAFALFRSFNDKSVERQIAQTIAAFLSGGNEAKARELLTEAAHRAARVGNPSLQHIVPIK